MKQFIFLTLLMLLLIMTACKSSKKSTDSMVDPKFKNEFLGEQLKNSLKVYEAMRNNLGLYSDAVKFDGNQNVPCSVASVGMALVSLCIADASGYDTDAEAKCLQTLKAFAGQVQGIKPARNPVNGFFRHWIDMNTGVRAWNSEYSSIDSGILIAGALFCKSYFSGNTEIAGLADALYLSIKWADAIGNTDTGEIYMVFDESGKGSLPARPFNEYMITAWLATNDTRNNVKATALWTKHYASPVNIPKKSYEGFELLTDWNHFLSNFVIQFPYFLCHPFTTSDDFVAYLNNAMEADKKWWSLNTQQPDYLWGTGAGPALEGYNADSFDNNPGKICSPQILAGFLPVDPDAADDLEQLWNSGLGRYTLAEGNTEVLWRFSTIRPAWKADGAAGVDWSTTVFGLAAHPDVLGINFFIQHNNFQFPK